MNTRRLCLITLGFHSLFTAVAPAQSLSIKSPDKFCWGENVGFFNWADAGNPAGAQAARFYLRPSGGFFKGFVWGENVGWINLGNGAGPYDNADDASFGINANNKGQLSGYAWGENIGWINFSGGALATPSNPARIDYIAGRLRGYAWGENIGWINLDDTTVFVAVGAGCPADLNSDGVVDDSDFSIFVIAYNLFDCADPAMPPGCPSDLNGDGSVDDADFSVFVVAYNNLLCP